MKRTRPKFEHGFPISLSEPIDIPFYPHPSFKLQMTGVVESLIDRVLKEHGTLHKENSGRGVR